MRITTDDGIELSVEVRGNGPALLLVHGFGGAKEDFFDHLDDLALTHRVATFDHRGHGASGRPDTTDGYSLDRLRRDTMQVADALDFDRFVVLGHSMGGMITRRLPLDHPHRIAGHIFMDTSAGPLNGVGGELLELGATIALTEGKDALKAAMDAMGSPLDNPAYERLLRERSGYQEFVDRKWADLSEIMWAAMAREIAQQADELAAMRDMACPVLVIVGELDTPFIEPSRAIVDVVGDARLAVIPDAGHSPQFENPDVWLAEVTKFLAAVAP
jgi:pimeloyl-ACP methyl ester carboxylesterase